MLTFQCMFSESRIGVIGLYCVNMFPVSAFQQATCLSDMFLGAGVAG
jgi:hypothetical protein